MNQVDYDLLVSAAPYVQRNVFAIVTRNLTTTDEFLPAAIQQLMEVFPLAIGSLYTTFQAEGDIPVIVRAPATVDMTWVEKEGKEITRTMYEWLSAQIENPTGDGKFEGIDVMFIEPDALGTTAVDAWHCKGLYFTVVYSPPGSKKADGEAPELPNIQMSLTATTTERGDEVIAAATVLIAARA